jgi:hypothetical protein
MMARKRYFTVEEANRLIPRLEKALSEIKTLRRELTTLGGELTPMFEVIYQNGGHPKSPEFIKRVGQFREGIDRIHAYGCLIKDLDPGLIDFPHMRDGREVYLCWRSGEREILYWHDVDTGFAGRQPI